MSLRGATTQNTFSFLIPVKTTTEKKRRLRAQIQSGVQEHAMKIAYFTMTMHGECHKRDIKGASGRNSPGCGFEFCHQKYVF
jgi:hypothetical protein